MWKTLIAILLTVLLLVSCSSEQAPPATTPPEPTIPPTEAPTQAPPVAQSADDECPAFVGDALAKTTDICDGTGRNQACYGNSQLAATMQDDTNASFANPGDIVDVTTIKSLQLSGLDLGNELWGIVLMRLQANLDDTTPGQNVTFLMFGDVELENRSEGDTNNVQSFYFASGIGDSACNSAPESGLLIQTPEGVGEINLVINEVNIDLGSTAYIQAERDADMIVNVVEGQAQVTSQDVTQTVSAGYRTTIALDENGVAESPPAEPEPYQVQALRRLPVRNLQRPITIAEAIETTAFAPIGFEVTDSIDDIAEVDIFEFEGVAGQRVYVDGITTSGNLIWSLNYNRPANATSNEHNQTRISSSTRVDYDLGTITLEETGTYQIVVQTSNDSTGPYSFKVWDVPPPDILTLTRESGDPDALIGRGSGSIETPGTEVFYDIPVTAGQTLYFDGGESTNNIQWEVLGEGDTRLSSGTYDTDYDLQKITFETDGIARLRVMGWLDTTGDYNFQVWDVPDPDLLELTLPDDPPAQLIGEGSGAVETPGVQDFYEFTVEAGQTLYFDGGESVNNVQWTVLGEDDVILSSGTYDVDYDLQKITFENAGTYRIQIHGWFETVGEYNFRIWNVPDPDFLELTLPDDPPTQLFGEGRGAVESPGVEDFYDFTVEAGQTLYFDGTESANNIQWTIYDENEVMVSAGTYDTDYDHQNITFENAGTYRIHIDGWFDTVGDYSFRIWTVPEPEIFELSLPEDAPAGVMGAVSGTIGSPGVEHFYTFSAEAGQTLYFDGTESANNIQWTIYDENDVMVSAGTYDTDYDHQRITFENAGIYHILVDGWFDTVGDYSFRVWDVPEPDVMQFTRPDDANVLGAASGRIESPGAEDIYDLTISDGQTVFFEGGESDNNIQWWIVDAESAEVISPRYDTDYDYGQIVFPSAGNYKLIVYGWFDTVGDYSFQLLNSAPTD